MKILLGEKTALAEAVTYFIERLHQEFPGITIRSISPYEDEEFTLEILVPRNLNMRQVEDYSLKECIYIEDQYNVFLLTKVSRVD